MTARHPYAITALALQGGGAPGAYQAGVYEGLSEAGIAPGWVAGISIGAINAALIVGNPPERRIERLRQFWERVTSRFAWPMPDLGDQPRRAFNRLSAAASLIGGQSGFFEPRFRSRRRSCACTAHPAPRASMTRVRYAHAGGTRRLRSGQPRPRPAVGRAVNIRTGNFVYFDSATRRIWPEHVMASGALPPAFPCVLIDGEDYWDGGRVSNTPLTHVLESCPKQDTLVFRVDLFGSRRRSLRGGAAAQAHRLFEQDAPQYRLLPAGARLGESHAITIVHLIYRPGATSWNRATTSSRASPWGSTGRPASTTRGER